MEQDLKFSRFMFHLKFSNTEDFVHEHELYEVMRSRNLYQSQFGVRSNFKKIMRNIEISEKAQRYGFENGRKIFVQKMRDRKEQAGKFKSFSAKFVIEEEKKPLVRRYVPIQKTTAVYTTELPAITPPPPQRAPPSDIVLETFTQTPSLPAQATPSLITSALTPDVTSAKVRKKRGKRSRYPLTSKLIVAAKEGPVTQVQEHVSEIYGDVTDSQALLTESVYDMNAIRQAIENQNTPSAVKESTQNNSAENFNLIETIPENGELQMTIDELRKFAPVRGFNDLTTSVTKVEEWAEKYGLLKTNPEHDQMEQDLKRLMIDRPSKWAVYTKQNNEDSGLVEFGSYGSFAKRSLEDLRKKLQQKDKKHKSFLPELDTTPKPMVTMDPGGTTPDGRLILTTADYDDYLSNFNKARVVRLSRTKKQQQNLDKLVDNFRVASPLLLRDDTRIGTSANTV